MRCFRALLSNKADQKSDFVCLLIEVLPVAGQSDCKSISASSPHPSERKPDGTVFSSRPGRCSSLVEQ